MYRYISIKVGVLLACVFFCSCSNKIMRFKLDSADYAHPVETETRYSPYDNSGSNYFGNYEGYISSYEVRNGGERFHNSPLYYVCDNALYNMQYAVECLRQAQADGVADSLITYKGINYSILFPSSEFKHRGQDYSDFLAQRIRDYSKRNNIAIGKKNDIIPEKAVKDFRASLQEQRLELAGDFYGELTANDFNPKAFAKHYKHLCSTRLVEEMKTQKLNFWEDKNLGEWRLFWGATPSTAKRHHYSITNSQGDWIKMTPTDSLGNRSADARTVEIQIMFYSKQMMPVIVGVKNPAYNVELALRF